MGGRSGRRRAFLCVRMQADDRQSEAAHFRDSRAGTRLRRQLKFADKINPLGEIVLFVDAIEGCVERAHVLDFRRSRAADERRTFLLGQHGVGGEEC